MRFSSADGSCGTKSYPCVHWGVDLFADDRRVFAPEAGTILQISDGTKAPFIGYGPGVILLQGKSGVYHLLAHLSFATILPNKGEWVSEGQQLAMFDPKINHCHYEVRIQPTGPSSENTRDPEAWILEQSTKLRAIPWTLIAIGVGGLAGAWALSRTAERRGRTA